MNDVDDKSTTQRLSLQASSRESGHGGGATFGGLGSGADSNRLFIFTRQSFTQCRGRTTVSAETDGLNRSRRSDLAPAAFLGASVIVAACASQLFPSGVGLLLVRLPNASASSALAAVAAADAAIVSTPSPGFAVLYGDATRVRHVLGLAVRWKGLAACSTKT